VRLRLFSGWLLNRFQVVEHFIRVFRPFLLILDFVVGSRAPLFGLDLASPPHQNAFCFFFVSNGEPMVNSYYFIHFS